MVVKQGLKSPQEEEEFHSTCCSQHPRHKSWSKMNGRSRKTHGGASSINKTGFLVKAISELLPKCKEHVNEAESPPFNVYPFKKPLLSAAGRPLREMPATNPLTGYRQLEQTSSSLSGPMCLALADGIDMSGAHTTSAPQH